MSDDLVLWGEGKPAKPDSGGAVVKAALDELGCPVSPRHRGIVGRHAKDLLAAGFEFELVVVAAVTAIRRGEPQNMQFIAQDLVLVQNGQRMTRKQYERALEDAQELRGGRP